jgi:hypothetical protein
MRAACPRQGERGRHQRPNTHGQHIDGQRLPAALTHTRMHARLFLSDGLRVHAAPLATSKRRWACAACIREPFRWAGARRGVRTVRDAGGLPLVQGPRERAREDRVRLRHQPGAGAATHVQAVTPLAARGVAPLQHAQDESADSEERLQAQDELAQDESTAGVHIEYPATEPSQTRRLESICECRHRRLRHR